MGAQKKNLVFFPRENAFSFSFLGGNLSAFEKNSPKNNSVFHFSVCRGHLGAFFLQKLGFFSDCTPENLRLDWRVFNSLFESAFKMGKTAYSFFLDSSKVFWNLSMFCRRLVKKTRHFSKHSKTGVQKNNSVFFSRRKVFFQFCKVGVGLLVFDKEFSKKSSMFCFCVQRTFGIVFANSNVFCGLWEQILASNKNVSAVFLKVDSRCAENRSTCFFSWKHYHFPQILNKFFLQFEFNKIDSDLKISEYLCKGTFG